MLSGATACQYCQWWQGHCQWEQTKLSSQNKRNFRKGLWSCGLITNLGKNPNFYFVYNKFITIYFYSGNSLVLNVILQWFHSPSLSCPHAPIKLQSVIECIIFHLAKTVIHIHETKCLHTNQNKWSFVLQSCRFILCLSDCSAISDLLPAVKP